MSTQEWIRQIEAIQERVATLYQDAGQSPDAPQELLPQAIEELQVSLEELRVAQEELRVQSEELAAASYRLEGERRRYQELFEFAPDGYLVTDLDGIVREANRALGELLRIEPRFLVGKPLASFIAGSDRRAFRRRLIRLREQERLQDWDARLQPRQGEPFPGALTAAVVRDPDGEPVALRWLLRDITERRRAEARVQSLNAELEQRVRERTAELEAARATIEERLAREQAARVVAEEARQRLALQAHLLDEAHAAVIATDLTGVVTHWNRFAETLYGWSREEAVGRSVGELTVAPTDTATAGAIMERICRRERWEGEWWAPRKEGPPLLTQVTLSPLHNAEGQVIGIIGVSIDISERRTAERRRSVRHAVTGILAEAAGPGDAFPRVLQAIGEGLGWNWGAFWSVDPPEDVLRCTCLWHAPTVADGAFEAMSREIAFHRGRGLPGRVWARREPVWVADVLEDANFPRAPAAAQAGLHGAFGLPILSRGQVLGVMEFFSHDIQPPDPELLEMLGSLGSQIGQFLERKRAEEALRASEERLRDSEAGQRFLSEVSSLLAETLDVPEALARVARVAVHYLADWCIIDLLVEKGEISQVAVAHLEPAKVELSRELRRRYPPRPDVPHGAWSVIQSGQPELVPDVPDSLLIETAYDAEHLKIKRKLGLRSFMRVPLVAHERVLGAIWLATAESGRRYGPPDLALAQDLARRVALAVENARLYQNAMAEIAERRRAEAALRESNERLRLLSDAASRLLTLEQPQEFIRSLYERLSAHLGLEIYFHYLLDEEKGALRLHSCGGVPEAVQEAGEWLPMGRSLCGAAAQARRRIVAEKVQDSTDPRTRLVRSLGITAYVCFPLLAEDRLIGTLSFGTRQRSYFEPEELALMQTVSDQIAVALDRARLMASLHASG